MGLVNRVKIGTQQSKSFDGTVFTVANGLVAINTGASTSSGTSSSAGNTFHFIPTSQISSLTTYPDNVPESLAPYKLDRDILQKREDKAVEKVLEQDRKVGRGVTKEAQELFNYFDRMYVSCHRPSWNGY
jgi:hypothetical protein